MRLYGRDWTRREIEARVGRIEQIGGVSRLKCSEGPESEVEKIQVRTGSGLSFYVSPTKGMDISLAEYGGIPISWQSANGDVNPSFYDARGMGWLRTAGGGMLMTCGLTQVGFPCEDNGEMFGLHGRIHHIPARHVVAEGKWINDDYEMIVRGVVDETSIFGDHLRLTREITSRLGDNLITICDRVENMGFKSSPHMMLYHFNFGFPLMSEETDIFFPNSDVQARDQMTPMEGYHRWESPQADYVERVYYHTLADSGNRDGNFASVLIRNPKFPCIQGTGQDGISVELRWSTKHLPKFVQWKMPGEGIHVLGIEPSNCGVEGRVIERNKGSLIHLEPGESLSYELELNVF